MFLEIQRSFDKGLKMYKFLSYCYLNLSIFKLNKKMLGFTLEEYRVQRQYREQRRKQYLTLF